MTKIEIWLLGFVLSAVIGAVAWDHTPIIGPAARLARAQAAADNWHRASDGWKAAFGSSEKLRTTETATAQRSANDASAACSTRVTGARRSATAIQSIVSKEPTRDQAGCPVPELVTSDELRHALIP